MSSGDSRDESAGYTGKFKGTSAEVVRVGLTLGEEIENQIIVLRPTPHVSAEFKVEQRFVTSMAIGDEGPHLDLTDWKHYRSPWKETERFAADKFRTLIFDEDPNTTFPAATKEEIYQAVRRASAEYPDENRWLELARECESPTDEPCYVGVSRIEFRIKVREGNGWRVVKRLEFDVPLGC